MAKGKSAAFLRELRRKHKLGEFSSGAATAAKRRNRKKTRSASSSARRTGRTSRLSTGKSYGMLGIW